MPDDSWMICIGGEFGDDDESFPEHGCIPVMVPALAPLEGAPRLEACGGLQIDDAVVKTLSGLQWALQGADPADDSQGLLRHGTELMTVELAPHKNGVQARALVSDGTVTVPLEFVWDGAKWQSKFGIEAELGVVKLGLFTGHAGGLDPTFTGSLERELGGGAKARLEASGQPGGDWKVMISIKGTW